MGRVVRGASCPWGELSVGRTVHGMNCSWGEFRWGKLSGNRQQQPASANLATIAWYTQLVYILFNKLLYVLLAVFILKRSGFLYRSSSRFYHPVPYLDLSMMQVGLGAWPVCNTCMYIGAHIIYISSYTYM
jgi:hypothetical protein